MDLHAKVPSLLIPSRSSTNAHVLQKLLAKQNVSQSGLLSAIEGLVYLYPLFTNLMKEVGLGKNTGNKITGDKH